MHSPPAALLNSPHGSAHGDSLAFGDSSGIRVSRVLWSRRIPHSRPCFLLVPPPVRVPAPPLVPVGLSYLIWDKVLLRQTTRKRDLGTRSGTQTLKAQRAARTGVGVSSHRADGQVCRPLVNFSSVQVRFCASPSCTISARSIATRTGHAAAWVRRDDRTVAALYARHQPGFVLYRDGWLPM